MTTPPLGNRISSRRTDVCRPLPSSRIACTSSSSTPASAFTSDDLPAPLVPSRAIVALPSRSARTASMPSPVVALHTSTSAPGAAVATSSATAVRISDQIRLRQYYDRPSAALPGECEEALYAADVRLGVQPDDDGDHVDIRREHLAVRRTADLGPHDRSPAWCRRLRR